MSFRTTLLPALLAAIFLWGLGASALAEDVTIKLDSGGEFTGSVTAEDADGFTLKRSGGGEFRLLWKDLDAPSWLAAQRSITPLDAGPKLFELAVYAGDHSLRLEAEQLLAAALRADPGLEPRAAPVQRQIDTLRVGEAQDLIERATAYIAEKNWLQALGRFRDALKLEPDSAEATNGVGEAYFYMRRLGDAREYVEMAIELDPACKDALFNEAYLDLLELDFQGCIEGLDRLLTLPPEEGQVATRAEFAKRLKEAEEKPATQQEAWERWADSTLIQGNDLRPIIKGIVNGPGWGTEFVAETDHYRVMTDISQEYAELMGERLELIYKEYDRQYSFSKTGKSKTRGKKLRFPVLVFKDRAGYVDWFTRVLRQPQLARQTGGVYVSLVKHLVFFENKTFEDTQLVAWHEAFHQYIDYFVAGAPHWFNEGQGEYFGASTLKKSGKSVKVGQTNPWRIGLVRKMLGNGRWPRAEDLMQRSARVFMGHPSSDPRYGGKPPNSPGENYAASWTLVHFCIEGAKKRYAKSLLKYFKELSSGATHADAFQTAWGRVKWDKFNKQWRAHCQWLVTRAQAEAKGTEVPPMPK